MKTMRHTMIALLTVLSASAFAFSGDSTDENVRILPSLASKAYRVLYQAETASNVTIKLYDEKNALLFTKHYDIKSFVQPFDLSSLPDGNYTFKVFTDQGIIEQEVAAFEKTIDLPAFDFSADKDSKVARLQSSTPMGASLRLLIYDQEGTKIHSEDLSSQKSLNKLYDLKQVSSSGVTFVILHKDKVVTEKSIQF